MSHPAIFEVGNAVEFMKHDRGRWVPGIIESVLTVHQGRKQIVSYDIACFVEDAPEASVFSERDLPPESVWGMRRHQIRGVEHQYVRFRGGDTSDEAFQRRRREALDG